MGTFKKLKPKKRQLAASEVQSMLKEEILQLQKELECQIAVRSALEKAMKCHPLLDDPTYKSLSQPDENLIKEIALLESEVLQLEKYLLSMYRRNFGKKQSNLPKTSGDTQNWMPTEFAKSYLSSVHEDSVTSSSTFFPRDDSTEISLFDNGIYRSHSSLSYRSASSFRSSPPFEGFFEAIDSYHSLPLSMLERKHDATINDNLAEYLDKSFPKRVVDTPNQLSEDMIRCISKIYCELSEPPLFNSGSSSSWMNNLFSNEESKEYSGSLFNMVEVQGIDRDPERMKSVEDLLETFRFLISRLARVDPGKLKNEEKLAFWINVHNSLVMHAYLVYSIPRGNLKRISLVLKAAYNIGGHTISVETIQSSILRCRLPRPAKWLQPLFFHKEKFKSGDPRKAYAIKHMEPRLHFALCSGCQSDAAVCVYTPKKVFQELEIAKEDYIKMNMSLHKEQRLLVPKNVEYFIKEMGLCPRDIEEMLEFSMPELLKNKFQNSKQGKFSKKIDWVPHNFTFRFLLSNELVRS